MKKQRMVDTSKSGRDVSICSVHLLSFSHGAPGIIQKHVRLVTQKRLVNVRPGGGGGHFDHPWHFFCVYRKNGGV